MATLSKAPGPKPAARPADRYNADMRLWMRVLIWATRNCRR